MSHETLYAHYPGGGIEIVKKNTSPVNQGQRVVSRRLGLSLTAIEDIFSKPK